MAILEQMIKEAEEIPAAKKLKPSPDAQGIDSGRSPGQADLMELDESVVSSDDYVYDTYIRSQKAPDPAIDVPDRNVTMSTVLQEDSIGVLIIDEEDEPEWQEFFEEDAESDLDWKSDDEDENGKSSS